MLVEGRFCCGANFGLLQMGRDNEFSSTTMTVFGDEIRDLGGSSSKRGDFKDEEGGLWGSSTEMASFEDEIPSGRGPAAISGEGTSQQPTT